MPRMKTGVSMTRKLLFDDSVTKSFALTKAVAEARVCCADAMYVATVACWLAMSASA